LSPFLEGYFVTNQSLKANAVGTPLHFAITLPSFCLQNEKVKKVNGCAQFAMYVITKQQSLIERKTIHRG
jgi:hypothetical protein